MTFELFKPSECKPKLHKPPARVSISADCSFKFNNAAAEEYFLTAGKHIRIFYDSNNRLIAFQVTERCSDTFLINKSNYKSIRSFFRNNGLSAKELAGSYDIEEHGALCVIDLNKRVSYKFQRDEP